MTSPNFHRRRLSNTLQMKSRYSTIDPDRFSEAVKLPVLNSISKAVKHNDISFSFTKDLQKLRQQPEGDPHLAETLAHSSLLTVRKKYDHLNKERQKQQASIREMEIERDKFIVQKTRFQEQRERGVSKVRAMEQQLQDIKTKLQEMQMQKKVIQNMVSRIRYDKVVCDQRKYRGEKQLEMIASEKRNILKEDKLKREEEDKTKKVYRKMVDHIEEQINQRQTHLNSIEGMIEEKVSAIEYNRQKQLQTKEVAENAITQKNLIEKNWLNVYLCHRFVQKMLQYKIEREMNKFSAVENSYKTIKTATGVSTTQQFIDKFLNKEEQYGILLSKITNEESRIVQLKNESEQLNRERRKLKEQRDNLNTSKVSFADLSGDEKIYEEIDKKSNNCYLLEQRIKIWIGRNLKKYRKITNKQINNEALILKQFQQLLNILKQETEEHGDKEEVDILLKENVQSSLNVRVDFVEPDQEHNETISEFNEEDFINDLRGETLRTNEKFMKQLRKKHDELRKTKIEVEPKRKEAPPKIDESH